MSLRPRFDSRLKERRKKVISQQWTLQFRNDEKHDLEGELHLFLGDTMLVFSHFLSNCFHKYLPKEPQIVENEKPDMYTKRAG